MSPGGRNLKYWELPDERELHVYKPSHVNHPSAIWCRETATNYDWLYRLTVELCLEYTYRYGKIHATENLVHEYLSLTPDAIRKKHGMTEVPQAMPDYCKVPGDPVAAYRNYYNNEKHEIAFWNHCDIPEWYNPKD